MRSAFLQFSLAVQDQSSRSPDFEDPAIHRFRRFAYMPELLDAVFSRRAVDVVHHQQQIGFDKHHPPPMEESGVTALCV